MRDNKKKNLLFIVNDLNFGGAEKHVVSLLNNIETSKFNLFLTRLKDNNSLLPQIDLKRIKDICVCNVSKKVDFQTIRMIANNIKRNRIDTVLCTNQYAMLYGVLAARVVLRRQCQVIEVFHTTLISTLKGRLQLLLYRFFFKRCDCVVFVSNTQHKYWVHKKHLKVQKALTIHNGIDTKYFDFELSNSEKKNMLKKLKWFSYNYIIGICAALRTEKAHVDLLDAIAKCRNNGMDIKLLIIGDGPERKNIERYISNKNLNLIVSITGFQTDVRPYIAICDCMVISSHTEAFSLAALEAMAMERPVIMTDIGGASEQVVHGTTGFIYKRGDIDSLAKYIERLSNADLRKEMGKKARQRVLKNFSLEQMRRAYERLLG